MGAVVPLDQMTRTKTKKKVAVQVVIQEIVGTVVTLDQMTRTKMKVSLVVATMKAVTSRIRLKMKRVTQGQVVVTKRKVKQRQ